MIIPFRTPRHDRQTGRQIETYQRTHGQTDRHTLRQPLRQILSQTNKHIQSLCHTYKRPCTLTATSVHICQVSCLVKLSVYKACSMDPA